MASFRQHGNGLQACVRRKGTQIHYNKNLRTIDQILVMPVGSPDDMRRIFKEAPNVMCEISGATHIHGIPRIVKPAGMNSRWLELIEDFPDRVMLGTDPCCGLMPGHLVAESTKQSASNYLWHTDCCAS
jgi:hypothetical protein